VSRRIETHSFPGPGGPIESLLEEPGHAPPRFAALVCHPHPLYGGTLHNKVVHRIARALRDSGAVVLRFNFRKAGIPEGLEDARTALAWLRARYSDLPYALAGFSFGARVITELGCGEAAAARFLLAVGFSPRLGDLSHLETCSVPKIFVQSTEDQYAPRAEIESAYASFAEPKRLIWIDAPDHFFAGALDELEAAVGSAVP
jgi:alpha/beta superfamily hydrolase